MTSKTKTVRIAKGSKLSALISQLIEQGKALSHSDRALEGALNETARLAPHFPDRKKMDEDHVGAINRGIMLDWCDMRGVVSHVVLTAEEATLPNIAALMRNDKPRYAAGYYMPTARYLTFTGQSKVPAGRETQELAASTAVDHTEASLAKMAKTNPALCAAFKELRHDGGTYLNSKWRTFSAKAVSAAANAEAAASGSAPVKTGPGARGSNQPFKVRVFGWLDALPKSAAARLAAGDATALSKTETAAWVKECEALYAARLAKKTKGAAAAPAREIGEGYKAPTPAKKTKKMKSAK